MKTSNLKYVFAVLGIIYMIGLFNEMFKTQFNETIFIIYWALAMFCTSFFLILSKSK